VGIERALQKQLLKACFGESFTPGMTVGSVSGAAFADQYTAAVSKKALDASKQQGQNALKLIESAAPANVGGGVGKSLNVVA
jgi:hypothetical protein